MPCIINKPWEKKYVYPLLESLKNTRSVASVIFLRGISGSGKTTLRNLLCSLLGSENAVCFSADDYFTKNGVYTFDINKISEAHAEYIKSMELALQSPNIRYIIIDNTHTRLWHLCNAENMAKKYNAETYYIDITVSDKAHFELCLKRQCHNVPDNVLLEQWVNWEEHPKSMRIPMFVSD
jgi:predicted kinase